MKEFLKYVYVAIAGILSTAMVSCSTSFDDKNDTDPTEKNASRTVLVYIVASNSLNGEDDGDIQEMQEAAKDNVFGDGRLLVYHQKYESYGTPVLKEIKSGSGDIDTLVTYDNNTSSVSPERMKQVITDMKSEAPADDYGIVLWSHSDGWIVRNPSSSSSTSTVSGTSSNGGISTRAFGEEIIGSTKKYMDISQLCDALEGENFSFVYFDCCYMACVEVLYEMREITPYVVGSTIEVIAEGMPYDLTLPYFFSSGDADLIGAVNANFDYIKAMTDERQTGAFGVFDMSKIQALADATRNLYSYHPVTPEDFEPQKFMYERTCYYFDFQHIIDNLNLTEDIDSSILTAFEEARQTVKDALEDAVIYKVNTDYIWPGNYYCEVKLDHFCGMSSYYITEQSQSTTKNYNETAWWNDVAKYQFEDL